MRRTQGSVILATMLVVILIYGLVTLSASNSRRILEVTRHSRARLQADYLARAGLHWGLKRLTEPGWAQAHTVPSSSTAEVPAQADRLSVDPKAPEVRVWLQETGEADSLHLRAFCAQGQERGRATVVLHRVAAVERRVYAGNLEGGAMVLQEFAGNWQPLPSPPDFYWSALNLPALRTNAGVPAFCTDIQQLRGDSDGNLYALARGALPAASLELSRMLMFDRVSGAWKLLPPLPGQSYDSAGTLITSYDRRVPTALAGSAEVLYALGGCQPEVIPALGAPAGYYVVERSTLYRLRQPAQAASSWNPATGWQPGSGNWEVVGPVPAALIHCQRAALTADGKLYCSDDGGGRSVTFEGATTSPGQVFGFDPATGAWIQYPPPPATLYSLDDQSRLELVDGTVTVASPPDSVVSSTNPQPRYHGGCEADSEGNLYWYLEPSGLAPMLPTLYRFEPSAAGGGEGVWKLAAFPVDLLYDASGQLVAGSPSLFDLTVAPDGELILGYVPRIGEGLPTIYEYSTTAHLEQPGRPRIPPLPGLTPSYDPAQPGLCRFTPTARPSSLAVLGSGGIRQVDRFNYRPRAWLVP